MAPPVELDEVKGLVRGLIAIVAKLVRKVDRIAKHFSIPNFNSEEDMEASSPLVPPTTIQEEAGDEEEKVVEGNDEDGSGDKEEEASSNGSEYDGED